jgi:hypothetical protein
MDVEMALDEPGPGHDDEVVATVADEDAARPLVESLLLAGVGPSLKPVSEGLAVCVVNGQGDRARQALGLPTESSDPAATGASSSTWRASGSVTGSGGTTARRATAGLTSMGAGGGGGLRSWSTIKVMALFLVGLVLIPAIAFFVSFKLAGG